MIYAFEGYIPVIDATAFIHDRATVIGNVIIGKNVYIGPGAVIRGDWGEIIIHDGCNVQENCTLHMFPGKSVTLMEAAHIGHGAVIHGAFIGRNCLVGMNSVIMDEVVLGDECIVGALTMIAANQNFASRSLIVGNPGKVIKTVSDEMIAWKTEGTKLYQSLPATSFATLIPCEPLRELPQDRPKQQEKYRYFGGNFKP